MRPDGFVAACVSLALSVAIGHADDADFDALFSFHKDFVAKAGHGIQFNHPELVCVFPVELPGAEERETDIVLLAEKAMGAEVWGLVDFPLRDMRSFWTGGDFSDDPDNRQTSEWGWIYDRNADGRIDWVSYINGSLPVVPEEGVPAGFPSLLEDPARLTPRQLGFLMKSGRVVYRHILDADFDANPDHILVSPISQESGFADGAMLFSIRGPGNFRCEWRSEHDASDTRPCVAEADAFSFVTLGEPPVRRAEPPFEALTVYWLALSKQECSFGAEGIKPHP